MVDRPSQGSEKKEAEGNGTPSRAPSISLPKGGGAIRGIGEKFAANPVTGTGSMTVPIATSPGRSGFDPQLSLSYDSGAGNGPFGFGWNLSLPSITRKTDKGLPKYQDAEEADIFILSGAEDLIPVLVQEGGQWRRDMHERTVGGKTYRIQCYRPRIEGLFARIERWTNQSDPGDTFWRSISKDNITTWYGKTPESRITDPADPTRIFSWLICESYDDKGNVILYGYTAENSDGIDLSQAHEQNRTEQTRAANRYLKRIQYGNRTPYYPLLGEPPPPSQWLFEVIFDYGEHDPATPMPEEPGKHWPCRNDPFSSYRAGFEVRTYRLCQRVLMFHHFPNETEVGANCLVRSTDFTYSYEEDPASAQNPIFSYLLSVTQSGYKRQSDDSYLKKSLPPLEFEYSQPAIDETVNEIDPESLENLPYGLDSARYQWVDLDGEGLSGILTEQAEGWFYKPNLSPINAQQEDGEETIAARFGPIERIAQKPSLAAISGGRQQLLDLAGDGQLDLVELCGPTPGFYERTQDERWETFAPFESLPVLDWDDPNLRFVDLTGDGHADIFITEDNAFCWHPSLAEAGFGPPETVRQALDEEKGPRLVFADGAQSIHLADLSGDGLTDLVRIRNGEACYWPNLGYGRFGTKITMDNAPWFDNPDLFDQRRIRLADIDGSGVTDILYLNPHGVQVYFNQSGNRWSPPRTLPAFPPVDNLSSVTAVDLLGNGTACLVWSSPLLGDMRQPMRYIDLMGGQKPHLLVKTVNNLGAETHVRYAPSTKFYLADKQAGKPWITRLPFLMHVVEQVETYDRISRNHFITRYAYHHGYFDGKEREFRGFGMVEQWDTEAFAALTESGAFPEATNLGQASHVPPVLTKTWFHTGAYIGREHISDFFAGLLDAGDKGEYYREPGLTDSQTRALLLPDTMLPEALTAEEEREACRALKGSMLRQEVYALDGTDEAEHPYIVTEQNFTINVLQRRGDNRHGVFFTHAREAISYHYERNPADPRIQHALTLEVDTYGNVLKQAAIGYGRRQPDMDLAAEDRAEQTQILITYTENRVTNTVDAADDYRTPLPCESRTYELAGLPLPAGSRRFTFDEILGDGTTAIALDYEKTPTAGQIEKRLIEHVRTLYRRNDLTGALPLGELHSLALPFESYKLAFTSGLLAQVFQRDSQPLLPDPADVLSGQGPDRGGYVDLDNNDHWWIPAGQMFYSPGSTDTPAQELAYAHQHFFLPHRYRDPFHTNEISTESFVTYDAYDLLMLETRDALGNRVTVGERDAADNLTTPGNDYRVLQPRLMMDPNRNRTAVAFDALGMVVGTAVMGKPEENSGDSLVGFEADLTDSVILNHLADPLTNPHAILGRATTRLVYDLFAYQRTKDQTDTQSAVVYTLVRETHDADLAGGEQTKIQHSFSYSDGFGREIQKKIQAEPGPMPVRDAEGKIIIGPDGQPQMTPDDVSPRWVGSGWTIFNNKGKPVRQYEPFFTDTHRFEFDVRIGVSPVLFYDPIERVVATLHPNHTWEKVVFDPWRQESWDVNDTVLMADPKDDPDIGDFFRRLPDTDYLPTWHAQREGGALGPQERAAARKAAVHADTPLVAHFDSLGRTFLTIAHNKFKYGNTPPTDPPVEGFYRTRVIFDIEGNQREVIDAKNRIVMRYDYDIAGPAEDEEVAQSRIHQASMEAGERWILNDVAGKPLYAWDSRGFMRRMTYDELRRPTQLLVTDNGAERLAERTLYGESQGTVNNHRTRVFQVFDGAGVITNEAYDFKGNLRRSKRDLLPDYKDAVNWRQNPTPNDGTFTSSTTFDALNRPLTATSPDGSVYRPTFNEANLLDKVDVNLRGAAAATPFVTNINYNAKGQRTLIRYANGAETTYIYDDQTFRLIQFKTTRTPGPNGLASQLFKSAPTVQDLRYTYDPAGNITRIADEALPVIAHDNQQVEPVCDYTYDAVYRLIEARGREHIGQTAFDFDPPNGNLRDYPFTGTKAHPNDLQALRNYIERYEYDEVGNFEKLIHQAGNANWTRVYAYNEPSLIEPTKQSNRLSGTTVGQRTESYLHDAHGNMTKMPHLPLMQWDADDQLQAASKQVLNNGGTPETTWYVYDTSGQRVRKVTERQAAAGQAPTRMKERIYLGGFEIYREYGNDGDTVTLERETLHVMDDQQRIALVETRTLDTAGNDPAQQQLIRYQLGNHLGSASLELDDRGQIISYEGYHPYGSTSYQAGRSAAEVSLKRYRYTGKERDEETGFSYHGARYYAPWLGRWVSCDPRSSDSLMEPLTSLYAAFALNPIQYVDPDGKSPEKVSTGLWAQLKARGREILLVLRLAVDNPETLNSIDPPRDQIQEKLEKEKSADKARRRGKNKRKGAGNTPPPPPEPTPTPDPPRRGGGGKSQSPKKYLPLREQARILHEARVGGNPTLGGAGKGGGGGGRAVVPSTPPVSPPTESPSATKPSGRLLGRTVQVAGSAALVGDVLVKLHAGRPVEAAETAAVGGGIMIALSKVPALAPLAVMESSIQASKDPKIQRHARAAGNWVEERGQPILEVVSPGLATVTRVWPEAGETVHRVMGATAAASVATAESIFEGTFGVTGRAIGEGAAVIHIRLTSDEYTLNPFKSQAWADFKSWF